MVQTWINSPEGTIPEIFLIICYVSTLGVFMSEVRVFIRLNLKKGLKNKTRKQFRNPISPRSFFKGTLRRSRPRSQHAIPSPISTYPFLKQIPPSLHFVSSPHFGSPISGLRPRRKFEFPASFHSLLRHFFLNSGSRQKMNPSMSSIWGHQHIDCHREPFFPL